MRKRLLIFTALACLLMSCGPAESGFLPPIDHRGDVKVDVDDVVKDIQYHYDCKIKTDIIVEESYSEENVTSTKLDGTKEEITRQVFTHKKYMSDFSSVYKEDIVNDVKRIKSYSLGVSQTSLHDVSYGYTNYEEDNPAHNEYSIFGLYEMLGPNHKISDPLYDRTNIYLRKRFNNKTQINEMAVQDVVTLHQGGMLGCKTVNEEGFWIKDNSLNYRYKVDYEMEYVGARVTEIFSFIDGNLTERITKVNASEVEEDGSATKSTSTLITRYYVEDKGYRRDPIINDMEPHALTLKELSTMPLIGSIDITWEDYL